MKLITICTMWMVLGLVGCNSNLSPQNPNYSPAGSKQRLLTEFSNLTLKKFPKDTVVLGAEKLARSSSLIYLKVQFARTNLDWFISESPFAGKQLDSTRKHMVTSDSSDWWDPVTPRQF